MTPYDKVLSSLAGMTESELTGFADILDMYMMCQGDDRNLFMYATKSFIQDRFFATFIDAGLNN